jgi:hypothetical protein
MSNTSTRVLQVQSDLQELPSANTEPVLSELRNFANPNASNQSQNPTHLVHLPKFSKSKDNSENSNPNLEGKEPKKAQKSNNCRYE